jgi:hypothetical protein
MSWMGVDKMASGVHHAPMRCELCDRVVQIGDFPFCPHESTRSERAQRFKPIVVFKRTDGTYSFPASGDVPTPNNSQRVEITTRRQAERLEREVNRSLREEKSRIGPTPMDKGDRGLSELRRLARGESVTIPDHDAHGNIILRTLDGSQMRGKFREYVAQLADKAQQPNYAPTYDPGFHIDIMHNDQSNRMAHDDPATGWKSRRE